MSGGLRITLRAGERIYLNGAVLRVDRKVALELLNDVTFLLEQHVMKPEDCSTPLRQLYFMIQTMVMDPAAAGAARVMATRSLQDLRRSVSEAHILDGLTMVETMIERDRSIDALKVIRSLFPAEDSILNRLSKAN